MVAYLTRPGKVLQNNINDKKIPDTEARTALKKGSSDTKPTPKNNKMLKYIDDHRIVYDGKEATKTEREDAAKRINSYKNQMSYQDQYNTYFNKKSPKYYNKKVVDKPKSNGKYIKNPSSPMDSFDWDLWLRDNDQFYQTLEEENKQSGILEFELASEYWQQQYQNYQNTGGSLSYPQFMQQQLNNKISKNINKIVEEKKKTEGIASILALHNGRRI